jgi:ribosomal protein S27AE
MEKLKNTNDSMEEKEYIDKTSEYYRICPFCDLEFMAHHMNQKYCCAKCGDDYNNAKKRFNRIYNAHNDKKTIAENNNINIALALKKNDTVTVEENKKINISVDVDNNQKVKVTENTNLPASEIKNSILPIVENNSILLESKNKTKPQTPLEKNYSILKSLPIDSKQGSKLYLEDLYKAGFDFGSFTARGKLYNIDEKYNCHFLQIHNYKLFLTEQTTVLITNN